MTTIAKTSQVGNNLQTVDFNGQSLFTFEEKGNRYTAMKPICENIGLDWNGQFQRIKRDGVLSASMCVINIVAQDGKSRDMVCLPIQYLNGWLFGVDEKRVNPSIKDRLIEYKKECYQVLHDYWHNKVAVRSTQLTSEQTLPLRNAVNKLVTRSGIMYPEGYKIVHQQFGVKHIKDLTLEQLSQAIEYVHDRILTLNVEKTPISSFTHNQYIMNVKREVMEYVYSLQKAIVDSGCPLPTYPKFDVEEICQAFIVSMIRHNRMMLSFDYQDKPTVRFIPDQHAVVSSENLADVVQFADRAQLPNIINEAVKRLGQ